MSRGTRPPPKDMYWFAHGGPENEKLQRNSALLDGEEEAHSSNSPTWNVLTDRRPSPDEQRNSHTVTDGGSHSSGPPSLERDDRLRMSDKRIAVEERRKQLWEAEQERNEAVLRKHLEREAALEARRNASRSTIAFAFGSSIPRNVETLQVNDGVDGDIMSRSFTSGSLHKEETHNTFHDRRSVSPLNYNGPVHDKSPPSYSERRVLSPPSCLFGSGALIGGEDVMSRSMHASFAPRGRRKNDLMPTVPYDRTATPRVATSSSTRKRSVSMTRLDQLALPRKHYLEANKASSAHSSMLKDNVRSPTRPLSSASENSGGSGRGSSSVTRRVRSSPRKPRPVSIAGTLPEQRQLINTKPFEVKASPTKRSYTPSKPTTTNGTVKNSTTKTVEKVKQAPRLATPPKLNTPKASTPKSTPKPATPKPAKQSESKPTAAKQAPSPKTPTSKSKEKKSLPIKKKLETVLTSALAGEVKSQPDDTEKQADSPSSVESEVSAENEKNNAKRIISEEEAKAALAEKRRLAREQAEREAELERQRLEELRLEEEERVREEEEEHRKMAEEQMRLLEEHRRQEEEKLRRAIEDQEQREEEERARRDEETRMKAEQEKKAKEEAEKQRLELEEKLRKEEEERAERKKRLEKIMSRTRGKSNGTSPSGSVSGSDQLDSAENPQEGYSSGANSLDSNEAVEIPSEQVSIEDHKAEILSAGESGDSLDPNPTYEIGSENESLNSNDLMMPASETASQDNSLVIVPEKEVAATSLEADILDSHQGESSAAGIQETSQVEDFENKDKVEEIQEAGQEAMLTSMIAEQPVDISQEDHADVYPEVSLLETQIESHLDNRDIHVDEADAVMPQFSEANFGSETQSQNNLNLMEDVENQENLKESDTPKISSDETAADLFSHESIHISDELHNQHASDAKDSSLTQHLPEDHQGDAAASEMFEYQVHSSTSSDMKLPDPIYETSEDGSISSEKHQMFGMQEDFAFSRNQENVAVLDDVFSQHVILPDPESVPHGENPFEMNAFAKQNPFSAEYSVQRSDVNVEESSAYDMNSQETGNPNVFDQDYEMGEENVSHSSYTMIEADIHQSEKVEENPLSIEKENIPTEIISDIPVSQPANEFTDDVDFSKHTTEENRWESGDQLNKDEVTVVSPSSAIKASCEEIGDNPFLDKHLNEQDSSNSFNQGASETHGTQVADDVIFIKENDSGACIGIISSIDHDQISNNLSKSVLINEQLKNNFESAIMTDSEDNSSLDSNLSQVMTTESNGKDTVETHLEITESNKNGFSNGEKHNLFDIDDVYNDSLSKTGVNNFHASEMFSNSHRFESSTSASDQMSELHGYVQLGGNGILSVDHSPNNIFETANPIDYGKVSPDPFLVKGNSGNPFLLQDEQKQVLMAPDFLN